MDVSFEIRYIQAKSGVWGGGVGGYQSKNKFIFLCLTVFKEPIHLTNADLLKALKQHNNISDRIES